MAYRRQKHRNVRVVKIRPALNLRDWKNVSKTLECELIC